MPDADVLIVGAGPTGLALACVLAQRNVRFRIIDASPSPQTASRAKGLTPRTLELFDDLGIVERAIANGAFDMGMVLHDASGGATEVPHQGRPPRPDAPYLSPLLTPQWRVEEALRDKLGELSGQVEFGVTLSGYVQDDHGVIAQIAGPAGDQSVSVQWMVGCDGGKSAVRRMAGISFLGETIESLRMLLGDVCVTGLDRDHWHVWQSGAGILALCPLPSSDQFQMQAELVPGQEEDLSLESLQRLVDHRTGRHDIRLEEPGWKSIWRANVRMVDRYRAGRVLLAGDAAHIHSPAGGQGMNTGLQDAYNLGWKLAAVLGGADAGLIDTYEEERLPIAAWVLGVSNRLMNAILAARTVQFARDEQVLQLGLGYRGCSLSQDRRPEAEGLRAGDRAPDAPGLFGMGKRKRIFDLLRGPHITLLGFGSRWRPVVDACAAAFGNEVQSYIIAQAPDDSANFVDEQGHARAAYGDNFLYVIRPDNYVGLVLAEADTAALMEYLQRITARRGVDRTEAANS